MPAVPQRHRFRKQPKSWLLGHAASWILWALRVLAYSTPLCATKKAAPMVTKKTTRHELWRGSGVKTFRPAKPVRL